MYYLTTPLIVFFIIILVIYTVYINYEPFKNNSTVIEYYSLSRCPHCVDFNPLWEKFEKSCDSCKKYVVDQGDVDDIKKRLERFNINSFPTIIVTKDGNKVDEMKDGRTCSSLKSLCNKHGVKCTLTC